MTERILSFIEALKKKSQVSKFDENETKQAMILPILQMLGWNVWDIEEVKPEYPVEGKKAAEGGKVDYFLRIEGKNKVENKVFLEAKRPGEDLEKHQEQLLDYSFRGDVDLAILTNGISWEFYLPRKKVHWKERKFYTIDVVKQEMGGVVEKFTQLLSRQLVLSGEVLQNAINIDESRVREEELKKTIPKAWNEIISAGDIRLHDLLAETTESICGFRPNDDEVEDIFFTKYKAKLILTKTPEGEPPPPKGNQTYQEFFQQLLAKSDPKIGLEFQLKHVEKGRINTSTDKFGNAYELIILNDLAIVQLINYMGDPEKIVFDRLFSQKDEIEKEFNSPLEWQRKDNKRNWIIRKCYEDDSLKNQYTWPRLQDKMVDAMSKFVIVFSPLLEELNKLKNNN